MFVLALLKTLQYSLSCFFHMASVGIISNAANRKRRLCLRNESMLFSATGYSTVGIAVSIIIFFDFLTLFLSLFFISRCSLAFCFDRATRSVCNYTTEL